MKRSLALALCLLSTSACAWETPPDPTVHQPRWARRAFSEDHAPIARKRPRHHHRHVPPRVIVEHEHHHATRVMGLEMRGHQAVRRDPLSNVVCFSTVESLSVEANTEDGAWKDAQRNWENAVRWKYGERFMAISNATELMRRCSRSSGNQSLIGRALEAVADAHKWRCEIAAKPCMAPADLHPPTKGE
jgi:hypothetical protein